MFAESLAAALGSKREVTVAGVAGTIADGMELVAHVEPDVVLMDVYLPDGDGTDSVASIRDRHESIAVIVLTATPLMESLARAVEAGAAGFLFG